jgi:hypothetical protein
MQTPPKLDQNEVREQIENLSRRPFRTVLARLLDNAPSDEAIAGQAERNPDRWAQTVALIARLGGFNEKLEVEGSITHKINELSDAELEAQLAQYQVQMDMQSSERASERRIDTSRLLGS